METEPDNANDRDSGSWLEATTVPVGERGLQTQERHDAIAAALFNRPKTALRIDRYTIVRTLGQGGMGVVFLAYDDELDRQVAIKLLHAANSSRESAARLQREAKAMARLQHPNVVTVYATGNFENQLFVAMEYIRGCDMRAWLKVEPRSWRAVLELFLQAGEGLAAAHESGIIHRDFKPDNVLVGDDGWVRIADLGLAHLQHSTVADSSESEVADGEAWLTQTGAVMGTPAYMAPEQFRGANTDERTDQFSFCVALWEALYGQRPFHGDSFKSLAVAVLGQQLSESPPDSSVPKWLRDALVRGLAVDHEQRWPSMHALLDTLRDDPDARRRRRRRAIAIGSSMLVVLGSLASLVAMMVVESSRQRYWNSVNEELLEIERDRGFAQASDDASRARDAARMSVYRSFGLEPGTVDHYDPTVAATLLREVETEVRSSEAWISAANKTLGDSISHAVLIGHAGIVDDLVFSPDATWLYTASTGGEVWRWAVATGEGAPIIHHTAAITALGMSPNGALIVSGSRDNTVRSWTAATGIVTLLTTHDEEVDVIEFSPDGQWLVTASADGAVRLHPSAGGDYRSLASSGSVVRSASFSPSGRRLAVGDGSGAITVWGVDNDARASLTGHTLGVFHLEWADDERLVSGADDGDVRLWRMLDAEQVESRVVTSRGSSVTGFDVFGERVVSAASDSSLQIARLDGAEPGRRLHSGGALVWETVFTPDGQHVAFACFDGIAGIVDADGREVERVFVGHPTAAAFLAVDAVGHWLATGSYDGSVRLWDLTRERGHIPLRGHSRKVRDVQIDAEERRVVTASADGTARVWDLDDGSELAVSAAGRGGVVAARFRPNTRQIALATHHGMIELWDPEVEQARVISNEPSTVGDTESSVQAIEFDASGARLAAGLGDGTGRIWSVESGEPIAVLRGHRGYVTAVNFEPGGSRIATASVDGTVRIWDATSGAELVNLDGHSDRIYAMVRSPDGHTLATASDDRTARLWPDDDPASAIVLAGHGQGVWDVAFDGEGRRVVTVSPDGDARVWDARDGVLIAVLAGHTKGVYAARFGPGDRVITAAQDNTVRVWTLGGEDPAIVLSGHRGPVYELAVSPTGDRFVSASDDGDAFIWRFDQLDGDPDSLLQRLWSATQFCLPAQQRVRELGEDPSEAQRHEQQCAQALGR